MEIIGCDKRQQPLWSLACLLARLPACLPACLPVFLGPLFNLCILSTLTALCLPARERPTSASNSRRRAYRLNVPQGFSLNRGKKVELKGPDSRASREKTRTEGDSRFRFLCARVSPRRYSHSWRQRAAAVAVLQYDLPRFLLNGCLGLRLRPRPINAASTTKRSKPI